MKLQYRSLLGVNKLVSSHVIPAVAVAESVTLYYSREVMISLGTVSSSWLFSLKVKSS